VDVALYIHRDSGQWIGEAWSTLHQLGQRPGRE